MKKLIAVALFLLICTPVFADNSKRIAEINQQIQKNVDTYNQYQQEMKKLEQQILMQNGALQELQNQDAPKKEVKDGTGKKVS
jgi:peptidoglycan hydrolase CwlO-like protein